MNEIVLVHGAWQGAWCWERVVPLLERAGRVVTAPTLTGSGNRAAELSPDVTLERHVDDVVTELNDHDRRGVVLVGHSYSGMVITGVAERVPERLAALVFVDAFYPTHGQSALDQMPPPFQKLFRQRAEDEGDGWRLPANEGLLDVWGLTDPHLREWVHSRLTDWSLNCFTSPVVAPAMRRSDIPRSYLAANAENYPAKAAFGPIAEQAEADGCSIHRLDTGHDMMLEAPEEFADVVLATAV
jgi:pimeloyl-ACP methyl ester carboxylesterase